MNETLRPDEQAQVVLVLTLTNPEEGTNTALMTFSHDEEEVVLSNEEVTALMLIPSTLRLKDDAS